MQVAVVGTGSWGKALSNIAKGNGHGVEVLGRDDSYSPITEADAVILCIPSYALREVCRRIKEQAQPQKSCLFVGTCKGIELNKETSATALASEIVKQELKASYYAHLAGPGFAADLERKEDTRLVVSECDYWHGVDFISASADIIRELLQTDFLRIQSTSDLIGLQVVGACRTTLSIVMGAAEALGFKERRNTMAALFGRTMVEISRFLDALGGKQETLIDVAGSGDLYLCNDEGSRNYLFGEYVARMKLKRPQQRAEHIRKAVSMRDTVEGYHTAEALKRISDKHGIDAPWTDAVFRVCHLGENPREVIEEIRQRQVNC